MLKLLSGYPGTVAYHLTIGDGGVFDTPTGVHTVLGSCVSVTLFCPHSLIGGIFHALLPIRKEYYKKDAADSPYRYVDSGIEELIRLMGKLGVNKHRLHCKVFGGANALLLSNQGMGQRNVRTAFETLAAHRIRIAKSNVGGNRGRKILFITNTNEVFMKYVENHFPENGKG